MPRLPAAAAVVAALVLSAPAAEAVRMHDGDTLAEAEGLIEAGRYEEALDALAEALADDPDDADAWNLMGYASRKLGRVDEAFEHYGRALALDGAHLGAHEYLGELYVETGQMAKAREEQAILQGLCPAGCEALSELEALIRAAPQASAD